MCTNRLFEVDRSFDEVTFNLQIFVSLICRWATTYTEEYASFRFKK